MNTRRQLLQGVLGLAGVVATRSWALGVPRWSAPPFTLGVASGFPTSEGVVLWTRLAPEPLAPDGGMPSLTVPVRWEVAADEGFRRIVQSGIAYADPEWAHSVHVELEGLESARPYWYRFTAGSARSASGRTVTAPPPGAALTQLRAALVCCQHYETGYYVAYRRMLEDRLDLIIHVGDYIYENNAANGRVRLHGAGPAITLADYRVRHALYRTDPELQAAHAACPWLLTWDDHDVANDYAGDLSEDNDDPRWFHERRAAAYRAYYEHLPLPRSAVPFGAEMRMYRELRFGDLCAVQLLDERQYRSPEVCPLPGRAGSNTVTLAECPELRDPARTMLGSRQEAWLAGRLAASRARWNLITQGDMVANLIQDIGHGERYWTDAWSGYPIARERLMQSIHTSGVRNPVVLSGDSHAFLVSDLQLDPTRPDSPVVASELLTTSLTSRPLAEAVIQAWLPHNPQLKLATGVPRGYTLLELTPERLSADLIAMDTVEQPRSGSRLLHRFVIEDGRRGLLSA
jgi:alkaline phosphatase D